MLALLFDENLNHRIVRGLRRTLPQVDCLIAQNVGLKAHPDPVVLAWAADQRRILVTHDLKTIPNFAYERVQKKIPMPGVIAVPETLAIGRAIEELALIAECGEPTDVENLVIFLPLR